MNDKQLHRFQYSLVTSVKAAPITDQSLIYINQFETDLGSAFSSSSTSSSYSNTFSSAYGNDVQAYADLTTGKIGTRATSSTGNNAQSIVSMFDTLSFTTSDSAPVEVGFSLGFDGSLEKTGTFTTAYAQTRVNIYDITALDTWLESNTFFGFWDNVVVSDSVVEVTTENIFLELTNDFVSEVFDVSVSGSFWADPSKTYGVMIGGNSYSSGNASSDFLSTSTFQFTNLSGSSFQSGSGAFLTNSTTTTVPEPSSFFLIMLGLSALLVTKLRQYYVNYN